tara:strand:+ start:584 stop:838 length:255 start_codon:yes stop_codon:yes gene_type:complete
MKITKSKLQQLIKEELADEQSNLEEGSARGAAVSGLLAAAIDFAGREGVPSNHPQLLGYLEDAKEAVDRGLHGAAQPHSGIPGV